MNLNHLHLMVKDIKRSQAFYETMFGFKEKISYGKDLLFMQNAEGFNLALTPTDKVQPLPPGVHYGFLISERAQMDEMYQRGQKLFAECFTATPQDRGNWATLVCKDPDGYQLELYWDPNLGSKKRA
jgi:catechol 2,3-dioxygenase-like lactoylglutathione lyase family enzyme